LFASLGLIRHLSIQENLEFSIVPATGLHSESITYPKGTFKARTSKGIFSQFLVFRIGVRRKWCHGSGRKAILLRAFERPSKTAVILNPEQREGQESWFFAGRSPAAPPKTVQLWKTSGNSVGSDN
jgi:hypothetical protein